MLIPNGSNYNCPILGWQDGVSLNAGHAAKSEVSVLAFTHCFQIHQTNGSHYNFSIREAVTAVDVYPAVTASV